MNEFFRRVRFLFSRTRFELELDEELRHHRSLMEHPGNFGNMTLIREDSRLMWMGRLPEQLMQDVRYGLRALIANKLFTAMAVLSLALGIGANTAIYSYVDAVLLRALPVRDPASLITVKWSAKGDPAVVRGMSGGTYDEPGGYTVSPNLPFGAWEQMRDHQTALANLFAFADGGDLNIVVNNQAKTEPPEFVSGGFFDGLGVPPVAGRLIGTDDDRFGAPNVAVLSYELWTSRFASDRGAIGHAILINNQVFMVVGVSAPEFFGVNPGRAAQVFLSLHSRPLFRTRGTLESAEAGYRDGNYYWVEVMGRLRPGVAAARAQAELAGIFHGFVETTVKNDKDRANLPFVKLEPGGSGVDALRRQYSRPLFILMTMVGLILAIACANIANLLLSRAAARRREMAIRLSLGAGRGRVIRQLLTESVMLACAGGLLGIAVAAAGIRFLNWLLSTGKADVNLGATLDVRVLAFTMAVSLVTGIAFGLAPALAATRVDVAPALKEARTGETRRPRFGLRFGLTHVLMTGQIAISLLLVLAAGLFVRTLMNLHSIDTGFNSRNVLLFSVNARKAGYAPDGLAAWYRRLQQRVAALAGVRAVTMTTVPLVAAWTDANGIQLPGVPPEQGTDRMNTSYMQVGPDFFSTMEIPILAGRPVGERDTATSSRIAVVNEVFVNKFLPHGDAIGRHFSMGSGDSRLDFEIVGVARNAKYNSLQRALPPVAYFSWAQTRPRVPLDDLFFEVRTSSDPLRLANAVRSAVHDLSPTVPVTDVTTQADRIDSTIAQELMFARLCTCFAALALLIACVGLYGTVAYGVARRTSEIGIRVALGATRRRIGWLVMSEVIIMTTAGLALGMGAAWFSVQSVASFMFGIKATDPLTWGVSLGALGLAALIAGYAPAWRASRIDPMVALRHE